MDTAVQVDFHIDIKEDQLMQCYLYYVQYSIFAVSTECGGPEL